MWGLPAAFVVTSNSAVRAPPAVGEKVISTKQVAFGAKAKGAEQLLTAKAKSVEWVPENLTPVIWSWAVPVLVSEMVLTLLVLPTAQVPKFRLAGVNVALGPTPVPERVTEPVRPFAA